MSNVGERLDNLDRAVEKIGNRIADNGGIAVGLQSRAHGPNTATVSWFEDGGAPVAISKSQRDSLRRVLGLPGRRLPDGYQPQFSSFGQFIGEGYKNTDEFKKRWDKANNLLKAVDAHNTMDDDSMGMTVLPEFAPDIAEVLYDENDIVGQTDQYTVTGNRMSFPRVPARSRKTGKRHGGIVGNWLDEGDVMTPTRARLEATELKLKKLAVVVYLTEELLDDASYALEQWITRAVRSEISFMVGDSIVNGMGGGRPLGYLKSTGRVEVPAEVGQMPNTIVAQNILNMYARRRPNVAINEYEWHINQNIEPQLQQMTLGTAGSQQVVYMPPGGLSATPFATLMGLRCRATEFNPSLGQNGDISLVRMKGYTTIAKGGINEVASQHVEFLRDQTAIKFTMRIDGRPFLDTPIEPYQSNGADFQSDFITLAAR